MRLGFALITIQATSADRLETSEPHTRLTSFGPWQEHASKHFRCLPILDLRPRNLVNCAGSMSSDTMTGQGKRSQSGYFGSAELHHNLLDTESLDRVVQLYGNTSLC